MKIYTPKELPLNFPTVLTIGSFDGLHLGHKRLIEKAQELANKLDAIPGVLSFDPHPRLVLGKEPNFKLLTTLEEKIYLLKELGIELLILLPFSAHLATMTPDAFVEELLVDNMKVRGIVIGFNFRFGRNRKGTPEYLKKLGERYGFLVEEVPPVNIENTLVSSTTIRGLLQKGEVEKANKLMGHPYFMIGKVVKGKSRGKKIGFPTANLEFPEEKLIPAPGVYAALVNWKDQTYKGAMNIGTKPTFMDKDLSVEVHLLGFEGNLYDETLKVRLFYRIREEKKFSSVEELKNQINIDCQKVDQLLSQIQKPFINFFKGSSSL